MPKHCSRFSSAAVPSRRETLARAVEEYPNSARTHLILAQMAQEDVDPDRATAEFEKAASADPTNPEVQLLYLRHLAAIRSENLLLHARDAARQFPNHVAIQCELGNVLLKTTNPADALAVFQSAVRADAKLPEAHAGLADAHAALGNFDTAIAEMRVALPADSRATIITGSAAGINRSGAQRKRGQRSRKLSGSKPQTYRESKPP